MRAVLRSFTASASKVSFTLSDASQNFKADLVPVYLPARLALPANQRISPFLKTTVE